MTWPLYALGGLAAALGLAALRLKYASTAPPANSPRAFLAAGRRPPGRVVVCLGDSLTHGRVSYNYVDELARRFAGQAAFVNAGVNSQLAWHLLGRLDQVVACRPDDVVILAGVNDALGSLGGRASAYYHSLWSLPRSPSPEWFRQCLEEVVAGLASRTQARLALLSLPPLTEDPRHPAYRQARTFSEIVRQTAQRTGAAYLPLFETMEAALAGLAAPPNPGLFDGHQRGPMYRALVRRHLLGQDWEAIGRANGFLLQTDFIHLNQNGGRLVADLAEAFLRQPL